MRELSLSLMELSRIFTSSPKLNVPAGLVIAFSNMLVSTWGCFVLESLFSCVPTLRATVSQRVQFCKSKNQEVNRLATRKSQRERDNSLPIVFQASTQLCLFQSIIYPTRVRLPAAGEEHRAGGEESIITAQGKDAVPLGQGRADVPRPL